jgi:uncharacterized coiled-coil DUF342 family protein
MASWWDRIGELNRTLVTFTDAVKRLDDGLREQRQISAELRAEQARILAEIAEIKESRKTIAAETRAELVQVVSDLRVRFAEIEAAMRYSQRNVAPELPAAARDHQE